MASIIDITNLKFYTAKGYEIPMQKSYVLTWELIPGNLASKYLQSPIRGFFMGDVSFGENGELKLKENSFVSGFIN